MELNLASTYKMSEDDREESQVCCGDTRKKGAPGERLKGNRVIEVFWEGFPLANLCRPVPLFTIMEVLLDS